VPACRESRTIGGMRARKRLVKRCTRRFRGDVIDIAAGAITIRDHALFAAIADVYAKRGQCINMRPSRLPARP
jgi:hypothetical protein